MRHDFYNDWTSLYDLMVDWDRRLSREGPALLRLLSDATRVLDVACGTGRHLHWLASAGLDVTGVDASDEMLARAAGQGPAGRAVPLVNWSMEQPVPEVLTPLAPFDALLCLGNSFPHVVAPQAVAATLANFRSLLRPGGRLVLGLKAIALLRDSARPFLPLVKRRANDHDVLFVRFYDFTIPPGESPSADFHLVIIAPGVGLLGPDGLHHAVTRLRAWQPGELADQVRAAGFVDVVVASDLAGRPWQPGDSEDIFLLARRAAAD